MATLTTDDWQLIFKLMPQPLLESVLSAQTWDPETEIVNVSPALR